MSTIDKTEEAARLLLPYVGAAMREGNYSVRSVCVRTRQLLEQPINRWMEWSFYSDDGGILWFWRPFQMEDDFDAETVAMMFAIRIGDESSENLDRLIRALGGAKAELKEAEYNPGFWFQ